MSENKNRKREIRTSQRDKAGSLKSFTCKNPRKSDTAYCVQYSLREDMQEIYAGWVSGWMDRKMDDGWMDR